MTQDEIIEMAIQAELNLYVHDLTEKRYIEVIEAFAKLAVAKALAQRTWVGLTDEQMLECNMDGDFMVDRETAKLNVQAKLRELNTWDKHEPTTK